jgi:hypothetical protein
MPAGTYDLSQSAPAGTEFDRWDCYDVGNGGNLDPDVDMVTLENSDVWTCVAVYILKPKLALLSEFPPTYNGISKYRICNLSCM